MGREVPVSGQREQVGGKRGKVQGNLVGGRSLTGDRSRMASINRAKTGITAVQKIQ